MSLKIHTIKETILGRGGDKTELSLMLRIPFDRHLEDGVGPTDKKGERKEHE